MPKMDNDDVLHRLLARMSYRRSPGETEGGRGRGDRCDARRGEGGWGEEIAGDVVWFGAAPVDGEFAGVVEREEKVRR